VEKKKKQNRTKEKEVDMLWIFDFFFYFKKSGKKRVLKVIWDFLYSLLIA
jgi:hypothetical protein